MADVIICIYKRYNLYIWVFGVADYASEVRFSKFKMADKIKKN